MAWFVCSFSAVSVNKWTTQGEAVTRDNRRQDDSWEAFCSLSSHLHEILDCVLLAAWLFTELRPWGPSDTTSSLWFAKVAPPPMEEVEKLKCKFLNTLRTSIDAPDMPWNAHLLDAIAIIKVVTVMTEGWSQSDPHSDGYKRLADTQIRRMKLTKDQFINSPRSQTWDSILLRTVPEQDRAKCSQVINRILGLIRMATWDSVSELTENFSKPLEDDDIRAHTKSFTPMIWFNGYGTHIVEINDIAMSVEQWREPLLAESSFVALA
ncbi:hypothetical protein PRZ48_008887 [Zasmidium cellare]|uniref:Uncharacterized protein n=1 Tax=Zasmidium cellare TaxID=395010 RepID=A0ABR0EHU3_ZASCE|nr:hypothetical protein PRZ48_008887 [Zasmidium cellare]